MTMETCISCISAGSGLRLCAQVPAPGPRAPEPPALRGNSLWTWFNQGLIELQKSAKKSEELTLEDLFTTLLKILLALKAKAS